MELSTRNCIVNYIDIYKPIRIDDFYKHVFNGITQYVYSKGGLVLSQEQYLNLKQGRITPYSNINLLLITN